MSKGSITKRGERSFRIKVELEPDESGKRRQHLETIRALPGERVGETRARARARLVELLHQLNTGQHVRHNRATVRSYIEEWLANPPGLNPKTAERYRQLAAQQIYPHLGAIELQRLDEGDVQNWHAALLAHGGAEGRPLSAMTVRHAHRLLHIALGRALLAKKVNRNVASAVSPPKVEGREVPCLRADQISDVLARIRDHRLYPVIVTAIGTGLRRGEILALRWCDVDLDGASVRVERSLGEAGDQMYFKSPKSEAGRRSVSLAPFVVAILREHRKQQLEIRMMLGMGRPADDALVFTNIDGDPLRPDTVSRDWANLVRLRKLPRVSFHALRHTNVSLLIAGGLDVHTVSRRIGHGSAALTLRAYTHMFRDREREAANAIENALGTNSVPNAEKAKS